MNIKLPYEPNQGYKYVDLSNPFMQEAMKAAKELVWDKGYEMSTPVGAVWVKDGKIIMRQGNGSDYHLKNGCERKKLGIKTGNYEVCPGCCSKVHCEAKAMKEAEEAGLDLSGSDMYMFGTYWCCEPCCNVMAKAKINNYYLLKDSWKIFDRRKDGCKNGDWEYFNNLLKS